MTGRKALIYKEFEPVFSIDAMYDWYYYDFISTDKRIYDIIWVSTLNDIVEIINDYSGGDSDGSKG